MKKLLCLVVAVLMVAALFAACAPAEETPASEAPAEGNAASEAPAEESEAAAGEPVTITWSVFETNNYTPEFYQHIIDAFEADNPDIKIEKVLMTGDSRMQFQKTQLAAGTFSDVTMEANDLANIEGVYAEVPEELISRFDDAAVVECFGQKTLIPAGKQYRVQCYYNKDQFAEAGIAEPPKTWDEFVEACDKLVAAGKTPLICGGAKDIWATGLYWTSTANMDVMQEYPNFNRDLLDGKVKWANPTISETLKAWQSLVQAGYYHEGSMSFSYTQASEEFLNGAAAMMLDGSWLAVQEDAKGNENLGSFIMPSPGGINTYCTDIQYWGVSNTSENKEAAFRFVDYVLGGNPEIYAYYLQADGYGSTTKEPVEYERGPIITEFIANYDGMTLVPEIVKVKGDDALPAGTQDFIDKSTQSMFAGADVDAELEKWDAELARMLEAQEANAE